MTDTATIDPPATPAGAAPPPRRGRRTIVAVLAALVLLAPVAWLWQDSLLPATFSMADMGYADHGGGPQDMGMDGPTRSVDQLRVPPDRPADVDLTLDARGETVRLASGTTMPGFTLNGTTPGPTIRAVEGQVVQVRLRNESVPDGMTLHWHGVDVPNGDDGVAGVTQDAVRPGGEFVYRFVADRAGTFWYHSHQVADAQVQGGLFGGLVISPRAGTSGSPATAGRSAPESDFLAMAHLYAGRRTINGQVGDVPVVAVPGQRVRVRLVNTDNGPMQAWVGGAPYRLLAVDGTDVVAPTPVAGAAVEVTAGGRADLEVVAPADGSGVRVEVGGTGALTLGAPRPPTPRPAAVLDMLSYGSPAPLGFDPAAADRRFDYAVGRSPGFVDGTPGLWWTVNGHLYPDVPMFVVSEGDVVRVRIGNDSGDVHPMHLHGHHAVVLARDGVPATGSPWWVDSLNVADGHTYDVAFVADNPGLWMDHCHNLRHAAEGLVAHVMYTGVTTPYRVGEGNVPE